MIANRIVSSPSASALAAIASKGRSRKGRNAVVHAASGEAPTTTTTTTTPSNLLLFSRRDLLSSSLAVAATAAAATVVVTAPPAYAQIAQRNTFTIDSLPPFDIDVPSSWTFADTEAPGAVSNRPTRVWFPADDPLAPADVNVSLVVTLVGADFTSLGSFGDAEAFGSSLVSSMDRASLGGPSARLLSARKVSLQRPKTAAAPTPTTTPTSGAGETSSRFEDMPREAYQIEYVVRRSKEEGERLFVSSVALAFDGIYNRLYTVTGQTAAGEAAEKHGKEVEAIVKSFVPPATRV